MDLKTYLKTNGITPIEFAKHASIDARTIEGIIQNKIYPTKKMARRISKASDKAVKISEIKKKPLVL